MKELSEGVVTGSTVKVCVETGEEGHLDSSEKMFAIQSVDAEVLDDIVSKYKQTCNNVDYKKILRNPEKARGSIWKATGEVLQVIRTTDSMQELLLQLYDGNLLYVWYYKEEGADNIKEEDYITVYGTFYLTKTYTTVLGETKTCLN